MNKFYLYFSIIGSITYILWGQIISMSFPDIIVDSFVHRFLILTPFILFIALHVLFNKINIELVAYAGVLLVTADYCYLVAVNNKIIYTTGLYVILTASLAVIHKKWFLWLYSCGFAIYCLYSFVYKSPDISERLHWANMLTLLCLTTFFGIWRIRSLEQLELEYIGNLQKAKVLEDLNNIAVQAAHDIRSPVMALEAFISSVKDIDPKKTKIISESAKRINIIADSLVDQYREKFFSTLKYDNKLPIQIEKRTVSDIVEEIKQEKLLLRTEYRRFKIKVHNQIKFIIDDSKLHFDIKKILSNLINNSIESFEDSSGIIDLILSEDQTWYTIDIKDNGKGIPLDLKDKIFEKGSSFGKKGGTGLGLSSAKELMEKYRGEIILKSKPGSGTLVRLTFNKL
jgi:signal transduction histidine kinase